MYLNALGRSARPKHVAYIDETNTSLLWLTYVSFDLIYHNGMNSTKIEMTLILPKFISGRKE